MAVGKTNASFVATSNIKETFNLSTNTRTVQKNLSLDKGVYIVVPSVVMTGVNQAIQVYDYSGWIVNSNLMVTGNISGFVTPFSGQTWMYSRPTVILTVKEKGSYTFAASINSGAVSSDFVSAYYELNIVKIV